MNAASALQREGRVSLRSFVVGPMGNNTYVISDDEEKLAAVVDPSMESEPVLDWDAEPRGKIEDFAARGYIGLQNHDQDTTTKFRNVFIKPLD